MSLKTHRSFPAITLLLAMILILTSCGGSSTAPSQSSAQPPSSSEQSQAAPEFKATTLRFGTTSAENTVVVNTMKDFAQKVSDATGGKVTVEIFPASQLGDVKEMAQSAQMGALDMCMTQPANLADMGIGNMSVLSLPYLFPSYEQRWNVLTGEIGAELLDEVSNGGLKLRGFGYFLDGARNFFTVEGKPIRKLEDVKGLKLRVQSYALDNDMAIALGASPTPTAASEMYSALQSGIVDGAEQPIAAYFNNKFTEVSKYFTLDAHTYNTLVVLFSELNWNKLDPAVQQVLVDAWAAALQGSKDKVLGNETETLVKIEAAGIEVIHLSDDEKAKWAEAMASVYEKHAADKSELLQRIQAVK